MHNASLHYPSSIFLKLTVAWQILLLNLSLCLADLRENYLSAYSSADKILDTVA